MMGEKSNIQIVLNSGSMFLGTLVLACQTICYRKPEDHNRNLHWSGMSNLVWSVTLWLCIHFFLSMLSDTGSLLSTGNSSKKLIHSHVHSSDLKGKKTRTALPIPVKVTNWRDNVSTMYDKRRYAACVSKARRTLRRRRTQRRADQGSETQHANHCVTQCERTLRSSFL